MREDAETKYYLLAYFSPFKSKHSLAVINMRMCDLCGAMFIGRGTQILKSSYKHAFFHENGS
jgi:hypothetical protein